MNKDALEAAQRFAAARRSSAYYEAGALTSSHEDVLEVVRTWRALDPGETAREELRYFWPRLGIALDALADGMQRH